MAPLRAIAVGCTLFVVGCAGVDHMRGMVELQLDKPDEGIQSLGSAVVKAPTDAGYKVDYLMNRDQKVREILKQADELRADGSLAPAGAAYERVLKMDPNNARALSAMNALRQDARNEKLLAEGESFLAQGKVELALDRATQVLGEQPANKRASRLQESAMDTKADREIALEKERAARYILDAPVTLQFSDATLKSIFEALAKSTGVNILIDRDVKQDSKATIFAKNLTLSDALDLILLQNQLKKRALNGNTLLIYPANSSKQAEYEDLVIRTFQVTNADIKYVANMLKNMLKLKEMSADEKTGILVIRDTPESLRMAERLIAAHDVADPEIMLEVEVLEVTNTRDSNLGIKPPTSLTISTPVTGNSLTLGALRSMTRDDLLVSPLSTTFNFKLEDTDAKILASPRIRARNKETAKIMIGDRVPTVTNTVTPVSTGSSVVTGSVTYQDVGLKLEFEPQVYANNEVGIKISLEVSNIVKEFTDTNGGRSYQIGTRNVNTNLRLKDGETQILGGLITDEDRNTASKLPGLGHLPLVGRLFGNSAGINNRSEIILAITPRIVRNLAVRMPEVKSIFSGTYNVVREKPILADPVTQLKLPGTLGGSATGPLINTNASPGTGSGGAILINPKSASTPAPGQYGMPFKAASTPGMSDSPALLPGPPPMIIRPPGMNK